LFRLGLLHISRYGIITFKKLDNKKAHNKMVYFQEARFFGEN